MTTSNTSVLRNYTNLVATTNSDAFFIEYDEMLEQVLNEMGDFAEVYTKEDGDKFVELANQLDGDVNTYSKIFVSNGATVGILN